MLTHIRKLHSRSDECRCCRDIYDQSISNSHGIILDLSSRVGNPNRGTDQGQHFLKRNLQDHFDASPSNENDIRVLEWDDADLPGQVEIALLTIPPIRVINQLETCRRLYRRRWRGTRASRAC